MWPWTWVNLCAVVTTCANKSVCPWILAHVSFLWARGCHGDSFQELEGEGKPLGVWAEGGKGTGGHLGCPHQQHCQVSRRCMLLVCCMSNSLQPLNWSLQGSYVHGIFPVRILEWVAISSSRGSSRPRNRTQISCIAGRFFTNWAMVFLAAVLIPACASSSPAFRIMYSACKLNKQADNIQPWRTPFPIWNQSVVPCPVLTVASWPAYRFLKGQVRWSGIPISFRIFHSLLWSTQSEALA